MISFDILIITGLIVAIVLLIAAIIGVGYNFGRYRSDKSRRRLLVILGLVIAIVGLGYISFWLIIANIFSLFF